jgi:hypothetical protein
MFRDEQPTTQVDPDEVLRLAKEGEKPARTADGSGGMEPEDDDEPGDDWCAPTRTMDPLQQQELAARSTTTGQHDILEIAQAPSGARAVIEPMPAPPPPVHAAAKPAAKPYIRGATIALLVLLVMLAASAILARHAGLIAG